ncbi:MAG: caspase family protein [Magnetococcales bacterium]|nr:caspase family protein [Magnetococcales bacterium]
MVAKGFGSWRKYIFLLALLAFTGCETTPVPLLTEPTPTPPATQKQTPNQTVKKQAEIKTVKKQPPPPAPIKSAPTTQPQFVLNPGFHTAQINKISSDAAGNLIATASYDKTLGIWDAKNLQLKKLIRMPTDLYDDGELHAVALSPDGRTVAVGGRIGSAWDKSYSIYLFETLSGNMTRRILGLQNIISDIAFSPDGSHMAAVMLGGKGLMVFSMPDGKLLKSDGEYGGNDSYSVDYALDGRLLTTGWDGYLRIYDKKYNLIIKKAAWGGSKPHVARFSPDGQEVAVGFQDSPHVNILSGSDLTYRHSPESSGVDHGNLNVVSWSANGNFLYAGGTWDKNGSWPIRSWTLKGRGKHRDFFLVKGAITDILTRPHGGIFFASSQPAVGIINSYGKTPFLNQPATVDLSNNVNALKISDNGTKVQFDLYKSSMGSAIFSMSQRELTIDPPEDINMEPPRTSSSNIYLTNWQNTDYPALNNRRLPTKDNETSQAAAVTPDGNRFLLGTDLNIYLFNSYGKTIWQKKSPDAVLSVNISGNGRVGVAAYANGTIGWFFMNDGRDIATLLPHKNGDSWVLWTPEGFFTDKNEGAKLIGYHINQGADKAASFIPFSALYQQFYRPDLIAAKFVDNRDVVAQAKGKFNINNIVTSGLPPKISFTSHTKESNLFVRDIDLGIQVTNQGGGFGKLLYKLNGVTIASQEVNQAGPLQTSQNITRSISLQPGKNSISVTAFSRGNEIASDPAVLELFVEDSIATPPSLYLLAVGISSYKDPTLALSYSVQNARHIAREIKTVGELHYENVHVETLFDAEATTAGIKQAIARLSQEMKSNDVFVLYIAGHNLILDGNYLLIPHELMFKDFNTVKEEGLSGDKIQKLLALVPALRGLLMFDTCNSKRGILPLAEKTAIDKLYRATGRHIVTATTKNQAASQGNAYHNIISNAILEPLRSPCL